MTPLSPDHLEELAAGLHAQVGIVLIAEALVGPERAHEAVPLRAEMRKQNDAVAAALRAGAAAWRIAVEYGERTMHQPTCALHKPSNGDTQCTCGLWQIDERLAALGGEGER